MIPAAAPPRRAKACRPQIDGVRDLEPYQHERLERSMVRAIPGGSDSDGFEDALARLAVRVSRVYLHVDLDVIDVDVHDG
jgi:arginase family enzyme